MKTINLETFNGRIKVRTNKNTDWIPIKTIKVAGMEGEIIATIKEVDGTDPLGSNERWMGIDEFIRKMGNSKIIHTALKEFIKMGYTIKMEEPKNKRFR